jgi:RHS repeat-associated protein
MQLLRINILYRLLLPVSMVLALHSAQAGDGGIVAKAVLDGSQHQLKVDSVRTVEDSAFFNPANMGALDTAYTVQNLVTVMINERTNLYLRTAFTATIQLRIIYSNGINIDSVDRSFTINYDSANTYNSRNSFVFKGGRRVTVKVLSISSNVNTWDVSTVLLVENQLTAKPKFLFSCTNTVGNITVSPTGNPQADELPVNWTVVRGADQYDLEWTYIDKSAIDSGRYGNPANPDPAKIFFHNATRVTIPANTYNIPLIYDNDGTLFIRVRPVQTSHGHAVVTAPWSSDATPVVMGQYAFTGHERPLNWQSVLSFAEEGKRKLVIDYFDGSMYSRQTVTKDNTTNTTLVAETYYDYQGRPAIQVMPAPSLGNIIQYTANFNVGINGTEYSQSNFDTLISADLYCTAHADSMSNLSGASQYYSPNNPDKKLGINQFIPNAQNYPFTETEYTQDNTGRVSRTSGPGPDFQLGSGRETKYYYGTPDQKELDALFGTEVGDHSHYFKNMVRDANGQYSVRYMDMHGRTMATALAGASPNSMANLPSNMATEVTESLADSNTMFLQDLSIINQKSLLVPVAGLYKFRYNLAPEALTELNCDNQAICYTCVYDLQITITDNCNNQLLPGQKAFDTVVHNLTLGSLPITCSPGPSPMHLAFDLNLPEGNYMITKKLMVNQDAYVYYRDSVYLPNNTCKSMQEFITEQRNIIAITNPECYPSCDACRDSVGSFEQFRNNFITKTGLQPADTAAFRHEIATAYQSALAACAALCGDSLSNDNDIRSAMLQDMTPPYGQYADTAIAKNGDKYSIFFIPPTDSLNYVPVYKLDAVQYKDANGNLDSVYNLQSDLLVEPGSLSRSQFVQNFRTSWAEALLPYHPEYCKLLALEALRPSNLWDRRMEAIDNFRDARDLGYLNPTGNTLFPYPIVPGNIDPLSATPVHKTTLENKLKKYLTAAGGNPDLSMWALACVVTKCDSGDVACVSFYANPANIFDTTAMCDGDLDMAWRNFRQLYLNFKNDIVTTLVKKPAGCTPLNQAYNSIPTNPELFSAGHRAQFSEDTKTTLEQNGLNNLNQGGNPGGASQAVASAQASLGEFYTQNCQAFAQQWASQLAPCNYSEAHLRDTILPRLIALCRLACDVDHPFGASTLPAGVTYTPPGTSYVFKSFRDIINAYNQVHGINDALRCNAELINAPQPYDKQPIYSVKPIYTKPSACECQLITDLYNTYRLSNQGDVSFAAYLKRTQDVTISDAALNQLRNLCSNTTGSGTGTDACVFLPQPILLPPSMQCNAGTVCISCTIVDSLYNNYLEQYPLDTPAIADYEDTLQLKRNKLFEHFMNNQLGFSMQAYEYLQFRDSCAHFVGSKYDSVKCIDNRAGNIYLSAETGHLYDVQRTADDGYIMVGSTVGSGAGGTDASIIKSNAAGTIQWSKTYGGTRDDQFTRVKRTADNGYVTIGTTRSGRYINGEMLVVKYDESGAVSWTKAIGYHTAFGERGYDVVQTSDGGYAALGIYNEHAGNGEFILAKLDADGVLDWVHRFGNSRLQYDACGINGPDTVNYDGSPSYGLLEVQDTLVVAGAAYDRNLGDKYFGTVYRVDKFTGALIGSWHYEDQQANKSTWFRGIYQTADGYLIAANNTLNLGTDSAQVAVVQLSATGNVAAYKRFHLPAGSNKLTSSAVFPTSDGGYLVAQTGNNSTNIFWQRMDASGSLLWSNETILPGNQTVERLIRNNDNSFTAVGSSNNQALVIEVHPGAAGSCFDNTVTLGVANPSLARIGWGPQTSELQLPVYSDTTLTTAALSLYDSSLLCAGSGNCYTIFNGPTLCGKSAPLFPPVAIDSTGTCTDSTFFAVSNATELYKVYTDSLTGSFEQRYNKTCLNAYRFESFTVTHIKSEYHYTLYYYDLAGNLVKTVPPAGVHPNHDSTWLEQVKAARASRNVLVPAHTMVTDYRYNVLNEVVGQHTPDAGSSHFWYDQLGRLAISQNAKQADSNQYSYTKYDSIGRSIEVGQLVSATGMDDTITRNRQGLQQWLANAASTATQITQTAYDYEYTPLQPVLAARNLRSRIAWLVLYNTAADVAANDPATATYYSYDILGNVDTLVQDYKKGIMAATGNRFKKLVFNYDLVSSKLNQVAYQPNQPDAFYHRYFYDAENRLTHVQTSADSINWDNEAFYSYYAHMPLARTVIGEQQVQGINYSYTLQGWLKGINPAIYNGPGYTLPTDGSNGSVVASNAYNLLLNYYNTDYTPVSGAMPPDAGIDTALNSDYRPLFNGNISSMAVHITALNSPLLYNYQYDQLNRLTQMDGWHRTGANWYNISKLPDFRERISYDPDGNILGYERQGNNTFAGKPLGMDSLHYKYTAGTNHLDHITDSVANGNYTADIDNQTDGNYGYDAIGNLTSDQAAGITNIAWTVYGKIRQITKANGTTISYTYDAASNRISKTVTSADTILTTWYVRNAEGTVLSVYTAGNDSVHNGNLTQTESYLYGASRLGVLRCSTNVQNLAPPSDTSLSLLGTAYGVIFKRGNKLFELTNHLGNVLTTISDKRFGISFNDSTVDHFDPQVMNAQDYYPFGMLQPERQYGANKYRYGFNGKENDNEVKGEGNQQDYGMRIYDPRIGRFLSVDPLSGKYPFYTPYQFAGNSPILALDIDGLEGNKNKNKTETSITTKVPSNKETAEQLGTTPRSVDLIMTGTINYPTWFKQRIDQEIAAGTLKPKLAISDADLTKLTATTIGEAGHGMSVQQKLFIANVYYNLTVASTKATTGEKVEEALNNSMAYQKREKVGDRYYFRGPDDNVKRALVALGDQTYAEAEIVISGKKMTVAAFNATEAGQLQVQDAQLLKRAIQKTILSNYAANYLGTGFQNQGYWRDMNLDNGTYVNWTDARAYYHLQEQGLVTNVYVVELTVGKSTTFVFDQKAIAEYFKQNPNMKPAENPKLKPEDYEE